MIFAASAIVVGISLALLVEGNILLGVSAFAAAIALWSVSLFICYVKAYLKCIAQQNAKMLKFLEEHLKVKNNE